MAVRKPQVPCPTRRLPRHLPTPGHPTAGRGARLGLSLRGARVSRCGDSPGGVLAGLGWVQLSLPGRTTSEGSAASSTAGARSSRPAWCAPSRGRRAPRRTLTSWVSGSLPQPPGRDPPPLHLRLQLHLSLCRGCFPPPHPGPSEPPHLRPLHGVQVSPCPVAGQPSTPSPSPWLPAVGCVR